MERQSVHIVLANSTIAQNYGILHSVSNIAILKVKTADYCCFITEISKSEAINLLQNIDSTEKVEY